ncbi:adhesion G protein-coupled receptor L4-like [Mya arenaria]|uniref:adhesion G protein-coupled receptor L4-like n=1 Tax=Mya arenaria TaxID=6604 RepID=UPI0022E66C66|nr:adhesion G protein-coupled receptor L4-like [Mya arenaria]
MDSKIILLVVSITSVAIVVKGKAVLQVNTNPGLIFQNAEPNEPVLSISAFDDVTDAPLSGVALTSIPDAEYFKLEQHQRFPKEHALKVKKKIDKPVGYVFQFNVYYGAYTDQLIKINVTERNQYAPKFDKSVYTFLALRNGYEENLTEIGSVHATDADREAYNKKFHYHILDPMASQYFHVDLETGTLDLIDVLPSGRNNYTFNVTAIDGGSPQQLNSVRIIARVTDLKPPDIFCVAVDEDSARVCWKDPTNGSYVMKYELTLQMDNDDVNTTDVRVDGVQDETCTIIPGEQLGRNYTFNVRVLNALEWSPQSLQRKVRIAKKGRYGDCPLFSDCSILTPCANEGNCLVENDASYTCNCTRGFGGDNCTDVDLCTTDPCKNGGVCTFTGDKNYTCDCPPTFFGAQCEKVSPCVKNPCGAGFCSLAGDGHICDCPDGTSRLNCDEAHCPSDDHFYDRTGRYHFPETISGDLARVYCRHGAKSVLSFGYAIRRCSVSRDGVPHWEEPETSECVELDSSAVSQNLRNLASMTKDASGLRSEEIANITTMLEEYFFFSFDDREIATEMTEVIGNLQDANESVIIESNSRNHSSDRLLWLLNEYVSHVKTDTDVSIETENINLKVVDHTRTDEAFIYQPKLTEKEYTIPSGISLKLPPEALTSSNSAGNPRIQLMTFRSSSFFIPTEDIPPQEIVLKQRVVSAVIKGRSIKNLTSPVEIKIQNIENAANHTCVFWDDETRTWSNDGMVTHDQQNNKTTCYSTHLTSFAVLLDPSPDYSLGDDHEQILTYISYIGCGISILGLTLTIITYSLFRPRSSSSSCINREKSGKILMNLCASMLILNVVFVIGSETSLAISGDGMCKAVAILLHYFLLTTLAWMMVEAVNMYQALITVFAKYSGFFMLKRCICAWGVPALIVIITISIDINNYKTTTQLCFLSQGNAVAFYAALLGPACLVLLINFAVFIMVSRVILRPRFKGGQVVSNSDSLNPAQIRGAFTVMTLLGITWVFGPFAIKEAKIVVNYVFTILNSLQGFLIFVFRCCFNPEVRMSWLLLIKTGKFKRRKGPISAYTSDTSSKGDSKLNGSYAETVKSNMYNSYGKPRHMLNNDKNLDKNTNNHSKASKDLHSYFNDSKHRKGSDGRKSSSSSDNGRLYSRNGEHHMTTERNGKNGEHHMTTERNGHRNGQQDHGQDRNCVTTIYTGRFSEAKRSSGFMPCTDEFTRL